MTESITVVFSPVIGPVAGFAAYHETLVYTDSAGFQNEVSAGPTISVGDAQTSLGAGNQIGALVQSQIAYATGGTSPLGTLTNATSMVSSTNNPFVNDQGQALPTEVVATGADLSSTTS